MEQLSYIAGGSMKQYYHSEILAVSNKIKHRTTL